MNEVSIGGQTFGLGERGGAQIHLARLYDSTELSMPIYVIRGPKKGPRLFISAALHGDEIAGTEVIKRVISDKKLKLLKGTLVAAPIVNVFGYNNRSRYLPDRRDLNRCFPGRKKGSLGARIADTFMNEVVHDSDYGIDLHTGSNHRTNLPQIRACLDEKGMKPLARSFGVPVILNARLRAGSLREAAHRKGVKVIVYEGGEGLRYDEHNIKRAQQGIYALMAKIGMTEPFKPAKTKLVKKTIIAADSFWIRAPRSGAHRPLKNIGAMAHEGAKLGIISDHFGLDRQSVRCKREGVIIGQNLLPLVNKGDALFHIATFDSCTDLNDVTEDWDEYLDGNL